MRQKKDINIRVGANIQSARERSRYTQEELSEILGITPNHMSAIERGVSGATLETIEKVCHLFDVSADSLLFGETTENNFTKEIVSQLNCVDPEYHSQIKKIIGALVELLTMQERNGS